MPAKSTDALLIAMPIVHAFERQQFPNRRAQKRQPERLIQCDRAIQQETDRIWHYSVFKPPGSATFADVAQSRHKRGDRSLTHEDYSVDNRAPNRNRAPANRQVLNLNSTQLTFPLRQRKQADVRRD